MPFRYANGFTLSCRIRRTSSEYHLEIIPYRTARGNGLSLKILWLASFK